FNCRIKSDVARIRTFEALDIGASPRQLHRAQARSYVTCTAITDGSHSHACNASAKQAKLRRLV
ncbi:hypothetical protein VDQ31_07380, partial [Xanthomonas campestris pv. campestris]|nr:hypothetical protein [Xanthomonas campestris pv. campestris]